MLWFFLLGGDRPGDDKPAQTPPTAAVPGTPSPPGPVSSLTPPAPRLPLAAPSFDVVREVTEAEGTRQASILNNRINYLNDIGRVAPMVGLLGTVVGMIKAFEGIGKSSGVQHMELAPGVAQALITTAAGLIISIPALIFYSIFRGKVQKLIAELEAAMTHIMALLAAQYKRANYRASARRDAGEAD